MAEVEGDWAALAALVKTHRRRLGIPTQGAAAERAGFSPNTWQRLENGKPISMRSLSIVAAVLRWDPTYPMKILEHGIDALSVDPKPTQDAPEPARPQILRLLDGLAEQGKVIVDVSDLVAAITVMVAQDDVCADPACWRPACQVPARLRAALPDAAPPPDEATVTLHWANPASPEGTASPGWTPTATPDGFPVLWKLADNGDLLLTARITAPAAEPPMRDDPILSCVRCQDGPAADGSDFCRPCIDEVVGNYRRGAEGVSAPPATPGHADTPENPPSTRTSPHMSDTDHTRNPRNEDN